MNEDQWDSMLGAVQALKYVEENWDTFKESLSLLGKLQYGYYAGLVEAGFTPEQALWLAGMYHPMGSRE